MKQHGVLAALISLWCLHEVAAHELWLEPLNWQPIAGDNIKVAIRLGTAMNGNQQIFMPSSFHRFELVTPSGAQPVSGRMGDRPAGQVVPGEDGLHVLIYETTPRLVHYEQFDKFVAFAREKGYPEAEAQHRTEKLPLSSFVERYTRHVKSLIHVGEGAVGSASEEERRLGMEVEFIARTNPYGWQGGPLAFRLEVDGEPRGNARVTIMHRKSGNPDAPARTVTLNTDTDGLIEFEPMPEHIYLLDHVDLARAKASADDGAIWISRWGALSFLVPEPGP